MPTNWPTSIDAPHDPVAGESMASGAAGDLAQEITNLNDRTVAIENGLGTSTGAVGTMVGIRLISRQVLASAVASVTFSSIPSIYENLVIEVMGRVTVAATGVWTTVQFNGDTGANYHMQQTNSTGAAVAGGNQTAVTSADFAFMAGASTVANAPGSARLTIPGYARTTFYKTYHGTNAMLQAVTGTSMFNVDTAGAWASTAAITSIALLGGGGNWVAGSVFSLYGEG